MATKPKKKREKKKPQKKPKVTSVSGYMQQASVQKVMMRACEDTMREVRITHASTFDKLKCINFERIDLHLLKHLPTTTRGIDTISTLAKQGLTLELNEGNRSWQYWIGLFTDKGTCVDIETVIGRIEDTNSAELTPLMPELVQEAFDAATYLDDKNVKAWAWIIAPTFEVDFDLSSESFIQGFIENHKLLGEELKDGKFTRTIG